MQGFGESLRRDLAFIPGPGNGPRTISPIESLDRCALRRQQIEKHELLAGDAPRRGELEFADVRVSRQEDCLAVN